LSLAKKMEQTTAVAPSSAAPVGTDLELSSGEAITLDQIKKVAQMVREMGGFGRLMEMLELVRDLGGLRRFRDLLEAMWVTESDSPQS